MRTLPLALLLALPAAAQDLKVQLLTTPSWPAGLGITRTSGVSWGDLDGDGWVDFFGAYSGQVWRNREGRDWARYPDVLAPKSRYGQAIADYDNDGDGDVATEPRSNVDEGMNLLQNLFGVTQWVDVASDPNIVDVKPYGNAETNAWADVDFDGWIDLFVPVYPSWVYGAPGNFFLHSLGPTGPGGEVRFTEMSAQAGLDNVPGTVRPEGTEFHDVDSDGDLDLYSGGALYSNRSTPGVPLFDALDPSTSGIPYPDVLDEGLVFLDYDLDGDLDLLISWCVGPPRIRMLENRGDGRFFLTPEKVIEDNAATHCLGVTRADFDGDGDIDFTTSDVFHRNTFVETGNREFVPATHTIPPDHLSQSTLAWADWDRDGDLDLLIGTGLDQGYLYDNTLYDDATPLAERRYARVRPARDSAAVARGLENEFGATAELRVEGDPAAWRRRQLVSSSGGYVNQHEYALHFGLPADPLPSDPEHDLRFDVVVDFPSDPAVGMERVDRRVNPVLGRIDLAELTDREITVLRGGRVLLNGCTYEPVAGNATRMHTSTGGLAVPDDAAPLTDPTDAPNADWYVGLDFDTQLATGPLRLKEVLLDGRVDATAPTCSGPEERLVVWDVTDPQQPFRVPNGRRDVVRNGRNHRTALAMDTLLAPQRDYRVVARVDLLRATPIAAPAVDGPLTVHGGLSFQDLSPCDGIAVAAASVDAGQAYLAVRVTEDVVDLWVDQGRALAGGGGTAQLTGTGSFEPGTTVELRLSGAPPFRDTVLVVGEAVACRPLAGGVLFPRPDQTLRLATDAGGEWVTTFPVPASYEPGDSLHFQVWWEDAGAPEARAASNALSGTVAF